MNIDELKDRIARAEEIQRYTENRCEALEKENAKAKEILRSLYFIIQSRIDYRNDIGIADEMWRAEQFIREAK